METTTLLPTTLLPRPATLPRSVREACLRSGHSRQYPGLTAGEWKAAAVLADQVLAGYLLRGATAAVKGRALPETHFEFRGGVSRGGEREGMRPPRTKAS